VETDTFQRDHPVSVFATLSASMSTSQKPFVITSKLKQSNRTDSPELTEGGSVELL